MQGNPNTNVKTDALLASATYTSTQTTSGVDTQGFAEMLVLINCGAITSTATATITFEESDASGSGYAAITTPATAALTEMNASADSAEFRVRLGLATRKRYIRMVVTYGGSGNVPMSADYVLIGPDNTALCAQTYALNLPS